MEFHTLKVGKSSLADVSRILAENGATGETLCFEIILQKWIPSVMLPSTMWHA